MGNEVILVNKTGSIAEIILNRPEKRNALNQEMLDGILKAAQEIASDSSVRIVVLKGNGSCFSSGIDLSMFMPFAGKEASELASIIRIYARQVQSVMNAVENIEKPVVAICHNYVSGLALELALACDFRLATKSTLFGLPEVLLGMVPDCGGTTRMTRALGVARAKEMVMLGEMIDANEAKQYGLATRIFSEDEFEAKCKEFVDSLFLRPALVTGLAKRLIDMGAGMDKMNFMDLEATIQSLCISDKDFMQNMMEGMGKVKELFKRK